MGIDRLTERLSRRMDRPTATRGMFRFWMRPHGATLALSMTTEASMADDTQQRGGQDRTRIDVSQEYELRDWSKKFGVTPERLQEAVKAVGDQATKVEEFLNSR
jgi:hypothetical protein